MRYELYWDYLLFELLTWNACVFWVMNVKLWNAAKKWRRWTGAVLGASLSVAVLISPLSLLWKSAAGIIISVLMLLLAFPIANVKGFLLAFETYWMISTLWGSIVLACHGALCHLGIAGRPMIILLMGLGTAKFLHQRIKRRSADHQCMARAWLINGRKRLCVMAIIDTGNSLIEPISGKPVCVLDSCGASKIWTAQELWRIVPWHGLGMERGMMKAYLLPALKIELSGMVKTVKWVYVAVEEKEERGEEESCLIIPPGVLE